ncbi:MAG: hypothetical protein V9E94_06515 [Microthrixaceae bacterium]
MRRLFWLGVGAVAGASGTIWAEHKVRARMEQLGPEHLFVSAGNKARGVGRSVVDAVAEGRGAMRDREAELRRTYDPTTRGSSHRLGAPAPATASRPSSTTWTDRPSRRH